MNTFISTAPRHSDGKLECLKLREDRIIQYGYGAGIRKGGLWWCSCSCQQMVRDTIVRGDVTRENLTMLAEAECCSTAQEGGGWECRASWQEAVHFFLSHWTCSCRWLVTSIVVLHSCLHPHSCTLLHVFALGHPWFFFTELSRGTGAAMWEM